MSSGPSIKQQRNEVAEVGKKIFGVEFTPDQVVNETLTTSLSSDSEEIPIDKLKSELEKGFDSIQDKQKLTELNLTKWIEKNIAVEKIDGELIRRKPTTKEEIAKILSKLTEVDEATCLLRVEELLTSANNINKSQGKSDYSILPFKVHQFISQTGSVYVTLDDPEKRFITLDPSAYIVDKDEGKKPLFPIAFSRNSGYEFICVKKNQKSNKLEPREFSQRVAEEEEENEDYGYIIFDKENRIWNTDDIQNLPDSWLKFKSNGEVIIKPTHQKRIPQKIYFNEYGNYSELKGNLLNEGWFISAPLLFDPTSGTFFDRKTAEGTKLSKLGTEGRSTSTTILSYSTIKALDSEKLSTENKSFLGL